MRLGFLGKILAYQMRTLSDRGRDVTKGGTLTRKKNKDMGDGCRDRRMQSTILRATSPELTVGRHIRHLPSATELPVRERAFRSDGDLPTSASAHTSCTGERKKEKKKRKGGKKG